jgi:pimeloyl-ACP methyl ester carboxylesterase
VTDSRYSREPFPALAAGSGRGLLLLQGAGGTPELNFPFFDALARERRVVAPYLPGTGPSRGAKDPLDPDETAERLAATAEAAGLETFAVLGYSLGSALAVRLAALYPARARALILTAGFARGRLSFRAAAAVWLALLNGDPRTLAHFMARIGLAEQYLSGLPEDRYQALIATLSDAPPPPGTAGQVELAKRIDVRADLPALAVPTLVITAARDALVVPAHSRELAASIPGAAEAEIDAGHLIAVEQPEAWQQEITRFLHKVGA